MTPQKQNIGSTRTSSSLSQEPTSLIPKIKLEQSAAIAQENAGRSLATQPQTEQPSAEPDSLPQAPLSQAIVQVATPPYSDSKHPDPYAIKSELVTKIKQFIRSYLATQRLSPPSHNELINITSEYIDAFSSYSNSNNATMEEGQIDSLTLDYLCACFLAQNNKSNKYRLAAIMKATDEVPASAKHIAINHSYDLSHNLQEADERNSKKNFLFLTYVFTNPSLIESWGSQNLSYYLKQFSGSMTIGNHKDHLTQLTQAKALSTLFDYLANDDEKKKLFKSAIKRFAATPSAANKLANIIFSLATYSSPSTNKDNDAKCIRSILRSSLDREVPNASSQKKKAMLLARIKNGTKHFFAALPRNSWLPVRWAGRKIKHGYNYLFHGIKPIAEQKPEITTYSGQIIFLLSSLFDQYQEQLVAKATTTYDPHLISRWTLVELHTQILAPFYTSLSTDAEQEKLIAAITASFPQHDINIESTFENREGRHFGIAFCMICGFIYNGNYPAVLDFLKKYNYKKEDIKNIFSLLKHDHTVGEFTNQGRELSQPASFKQIYDNLREFITSLNTTTHNENEYASTILAVFDRDETGSSNANEKSPTPQPTASTPITLPHQPPQIYHFVDDMVEKLAIVEKDSNVIEPIYTVDKDSSTIKNHYPWFWKTFAILAVVSKVISSGFLSALGILATFTLIGLPLSPFLFWTVAAANGMTCLLTRGKAIYQHVSKGNSFIVCTNHDGSRGKKAMRTYWLNTICAFLTSLLGAGTFWTNVLGTGLATTKIVILGSAISTVWLLALPLAIICGLSAACFQGVAAKKNIAENKPVKHPLFVFFLMLGPTITTIGQIAHIFGYTLLSVTIATPLVLLGYTIATKYSQAPKVSEKLDKINAWLARHDKLDSLKGWIQSKEKSFKEWIRTTSGLDIFCTIVAKVMMTTVCLIGLFDTIMFSFGCLGMTFGIIAGIHLGIVVSLVPLLVVAAIVCIPQALLSGCFTLPDLFKSVDNIANKFAKLLAKSLRCVGSFFKRVFHLQHKAETNPQTAEQPTSESQQLTVPVSATPATTASRESVATVNMPSTGSVTTPPQAPVALSLTTEPTTDNVMVSQPPVVPLSGAEPPNNVDTEQAAATSKNSSVPSPIASAMSKIGCFAHTAAPPSTTTVSVNDQENRDNLDDAQPLVQEQESTDRSITVAANS